MIFLLFLNACAKKQYTIKSVDGYLVEMNNRFDSSPDPEMLSLVNYYKHKLDEEMHEIVGEAAQALTKSGQQSVLANFTADAMHEYGAGLWGPVDLAVINNGGLRTTLNQGKITIGNLYEIYTFDNCLVLLELSGKSVERLFDDFSQKKIEGFSKNVVLTLKNNAIETMTVGGKLLDENATYRLVTVDYLAEGNDGMDALKQATKYTDSGIILRDAMIEYIKKLTANNIIINAKPDGRIEIKD